MPATRASAPTSTPPGPSSPPPPPSPPPPRPAAPPPPPRAPTPPRLRRPSLLNLFQLAYMEYRFGEKAAARSDLEAILKRSADYRQAQSLLAQLELLAGNPERAVTIYQRLVRGRPRLADINNLGIAYLL